MMKEDPAGEYRADDRMKESKTLEFKNLSPGIFSKQSAPIQITVPAR